MSIKNLTFRGNRMKVLNPNQINKLNFYRFLTNLLKLLIISIFMRLINKNSHCRATLPDGVYCRTGFATPSETYAGD